MHQSIYQTGHVINAAAAAAAAADAACVRWTKTGRNGETPRAGRVLRRLHPGAHQVGQLGVRGRAHAIRPVDGRLWAGRLTWPFPSARPDPAVDVPSLPHYFPPPLFLPSMPRSIIGCSPSPLCVDAAGAADAAACRVLSWSCAFFLDDERERERIGARN